MIRHHRLAIAVLGCALAAPLVAEDGPATLSTTFNLLVGFPDEPSTAVTLIPGTVIPDASTASVATTLERSQVLASLSAKLRDTLRLGRVEVRYEQGLDLRVGGPTATLPGPSSRSAFLPRVQVVSADAKTATYQIEFLQGGKTVQQMPLSVAMGRRSVVGMLDGPDAPYLFLVVEPNRTFALEAVSESSTTPPRLLSRVLPEYPKGAEKQEALVVLEASIGVDGKVGAVKVLSGEAEFQPAALAAVRQWTFEPATVDGKPVAVQYTLTIRFVPESVPNGSQP